MAQPPRPLSSSGPPKAMHINTTPRKDSSSNTSTPSVSHRSSLAELSNRGYPPSPRTTRTTSFSGPALTELLMHPSTSSAQHTRDTARFAGRDWQEITVGEIVDPSETRFVELDTSIEATTKLLVKSGAPNVVLLRETRKTKTAIGTFDYSDLNAYLLLVLGLSQPDELAQQLAERARKGEAIPMSDLNDHLGAREEPAYLPASASLTKAMEVLGGGAHRVVVCKEGTSEAFGVLSQLRLVRFFWENHKNFEATEGLYASTLQELGLGKKDVLAVQGDKAVAEALRIMHDEGVTSLPVLDASQNVVGNISHVDVRLLTDTSSIPLLSSPCLAFISHILSERGVAEGKDSYPVFHVTPSTTLAQTVAKLVATRSHRMWIVEAPSPSPSLPPSTPHSAAHSQHSFPALPAPMRTPTSENHPVQQGGLPGSTISGRLSGVISLTDVLNLFARASGLHPSDPEVVRQSRKRRGSSSASSSRTSLSLVR